MTDRVYMHMPFGDAVDLAGVVAEREALRRQLREAQERLAALEGVIRADDERLLKATERVGLAPMGCDTADWLAEEVLGFRRAAAARLRAVKRMKKCAEIYRMSFRKVAGQRHDNA